MRTKIRRLIRRLFMTGSLLIFVGVGVMIGLAIGRNSADRGPTIIIRADNAAALARQPAGLAPLPTIPPIPTVPPIPQIPPVPDVPQVIHIEHGPSFIELVDGISTVLAAFGLIALGIVLIRRERQQPQEKSPETLPK